MLFAFRSWCSSWLACIPFKQYINTSRMEGTKERLWSHNILRCKSIAVVVTVIVSLPFLLSMDKLMLCYLQFNFQLITYCTNPACFRSSGHPHRVLRIKFFPVLLVLLTLLNWCKIQNIHLRYFTIYPNLFIIYLI